jgi:hypothetical protein
MQFNLFDDDAVENALEQDNRLYRGEYFAIAPSKTVFINKRDGVLMTTKRLNAIGHLTELRHPITNFPVLPVEVFRWAENEFYVRLVYSNKQDVPMEKIVSLDVIKKKGMPELRKELQADGVVLNSMDATALGKVLLDVLRVGSAQGSITMHNKVSRREWTVQGICLVPRSTVAPLTLVHSQPN